MARTRRKREAPPERRAAFRFPVSGRRSQGLLRVEKRSYDVQVLDESAGGFAVEYDGTLALHIGQTVDLTVDEEHIHARVAFVDTQDVGVERLTEGALTSQTRLGLERIPEDACKSTDKLARPRIRFRRPLVLLRHNSMLLAAVGFIAALVLVGLSVMRRLERSYALNPFKEDESAAHVARIESLDLVPDTQLTVGRSEGKNLELPGELPEVPDLPDWIDAGSGRPRRAAPVKPPKEEPPRPLQRVITRSALPPSAKAAAKRMADQIDSAAETVGDAVARLDENTFRMAQPEFLLRQDVVQRLGLTHAQQVRLQRLMEEAQAGAAGAGGQAAGLSEAERLALGRRAVNKLTREQQQLLMAMQHTMPEADPQP